MPRALKTQGSRGLGRLAFADNYLRLVARFKRDLQQISHPDVIYQSVSQTGLALRDNIPRVYVIACASGGASGYLADLGYSVRRLLQQLRVPDAARHQPCCSVRAQRPGHAARRAGANIYATLTELNHFADSAIPFSAQYGTDGPRLVDEGAGRSTTPTLITLANRAPGSWPAQTAMLPTWAATCSTS